MNRRDNIIEPMPPPEPAWLRWWRANPTSQKVEHVETKGKRKRSRRERRAGR